MNQSERTALTWSKVKDKVGAEEVYSFKVTVELLKAGEYYKKLKGKAKNRTLMKSNPKLFASIYKHTQHLEQAFTEQKAYKINYSFYYRILFLVEHSADLARLKCSCGKKYTWTAYCRYCPDYKRNQLNKPHTEETKLKMRKAALEYLEKTKGQVIPRYNIDSIPVIEEYGRKHGYRFMHAENGGEYFIKELGYFVDAYDPIHNVVLEVDEPFHFTATGELRKRDQERQSQIETLLECTFIRLKYDHNIRKHQVQS
jgi:hypothetical protein